MRNAVEAADTRQARVIAEFIHIGWIQRISRAVIGFGKPPGQHNPQFGGVLAAADGRLRVFIQFPVDFRHAARLCARAAAAAHEYVNISRINALLGQHVQDNLVPERHLVIDVRILQQYRRVMELAPAENFLFIFKETDFGGCRSGIDHQQFVNHCFPTPCCLPDFSPRIIL